jgi:pimeloyl-ACP methyl ester carboxylesterase
MKTVEHFVPNHDGAELSLAQTWDERRLVPGRRPVLIVPGYGMNSYIFSYHPRGLSFEGHLAEAGFEVWRVDLRGQGNSRPGPSARTGKRTDADDFGLEDLAGDLGVAASAALERTRTGASRVSVIGCSLGGTIAFLHAALEPRHRLGALVAIGTPVRWVKVHPLVKLAFAWPELVGLVRFKGTRKFAELALPLLARRIPWVLSIYMNTDHIDTSAVRSLVKTVEDPNRYVNRQIAYWIQRRDLVVRGMNLSEALRRFDLPLLCVYGSGDGIVPRETAEFAYRQAASRDKHLLEVGAGEHAMAHADMFVSNEAQERVFAPVTDWLRAREEPPGR